jgi:hypothetical protein
MEPGPREHLARDVGGQLDKYPNGTFEVALCVFVAIHGRILHGKVVENDGQGELVTARFSGTYGLEQDPFGLFQVSLSLQLNGSRQVFRQYRLREDQTWK